MVLNKNSVVFLLVLEPLVFVSEGRLVVGMQTRIKKTYMYDPVMSEV